MHDLHLERFSRRAGRRPDQDVHAARHQGESAVYARRPLLNARGHSGVLQYSFAAQACAPGEAGFSGLHETVITSANGGTILADRGWGKISAENSGLNCRYLFRYCVLSMRKALTASLLTIVALIGLGRAETKIDGPIVLFMGPPGSGKSTQGQLRRDC